MNTKKQKLVYGNNEMMKTFKATTNLANALMKERITPKHKLQAVGKGLKFIFKSISFSH
jgi:hypothetical protein